MYGKERLGAVNVGGLKLEAPVMNGAGPGKLPEDVLKIAESGAAAVVVGSITIEPRQGNTGTTYFFDHKGEFSINSKGLPNPGLEYYQENLHTMRRIANDRGKPLIVSVAGFSPQEYARLATEVMSKDRADGVEINLGCPNIWGNDGMQKPIASYHPDLIGEILRNVEVELGSEGWISVKLSKVNDPVKLAQIADIVGSFPLVNAVTSINTIPNAFAFNKYGEPAITPAGGLGGLGGRAIKTESLGQIVQLKGMLPKRIDIIGAGGIQTIEDVEQYCEVGAIATQVTTAYINLGPKIFSKLVDAR